MFSLISDYSSSTAFGASFGVGVLVAVIAVVVGVLIWRVHKGRNARKENSRGYYGMRRIIIQNLISA